MNDWYCQLLDEREAERKECRKEGYERGYATRDGEFRWGEFFCYGALWFAIFVGMATAGAWVLQIITHSASRP